MSACWVLVGTGMKGRMEEAQTLTALGGEDGPPPQVREDMEKLLTASLRARGVAGDVSFHLLRDRAMEAAMAAGEGNV